MHTQNHHVHSSHLKHKELTVALIDYCKKKVLIKNAFNVALLF